MTSTDVFQQEPCQRRRHIDIEVVRYGDIGQPVPSDVVGFHRQIVVTIDVNRTRRE